MTYPIRFGLENFRPGNGKYNFSVTLPGDFLLRCSQSLRHSNLEQTINTLGSNIIKRVLKESNYTPYTFDGTTLLAKQISIGSGGKYLSLDSREFKDIESSLNPEKLKADFNSHNIDTADEAYTLLSLLTAWAEYADANIAT